MQISAARFLALMVFFFSATETVHAATFSVGAQMNFKTTHSSEGQSCEANCWEVWQSANGLGQLLVEKNAFGAFVKVGRITEPYFQDLFASVDEAHRKIPLSARVTRFGTVTGFHSSIDDCAANCSMTVDFGTYRGIAVVLDSTGAIVSLGAPGDGMTRPTHDETVPVSPDSRPPHDNECSNNVAGPNCFTYSVQNVDIPGPDGIMINNISITVRFWHNEHGQIDYSQFHYQQWGGRNYGSWNPAQALNQSDVVNIFP